MIRWQRSKIYIAIFAGACIASSTLAWANPTAERPLAERPVRGRQLSVTVPEQRRQVLKQLARTIGRDVPGYGVVFRTTPKKGKKHTEGALMVATVKYGKPSMDAWKTHVAKNSIGFLVDRGPGNARTSGSGHVRVGELYIPYYNVHYPNSFSDMADIGNLENTHTEATFMVDEPTLAAFMAFYFARHYGLVKNEAGVPIVPAFKPNEKGMVEEGCTGAATSALGTDWVRAFERCLPKIKRFGQEHEIAELANAPDNAASLLRAFAKQTKIKPKAEAQTMVRMFSLKADMLTVINSWLDNPAQDLKWNRTVRMYTKPSSSTRAGQVVRDKNAMSWMGWPPSPFTIYDLAPGETHKSFQAERMNLLDFANAL